jgi:hypothetical protein
MRIHIHIVDAASALQHNIDIVSVIQIVFIVNRVLFI